MIRLKTTLSFVFFFACVLSSFATITHTDNPTTVGCADTFTTTLSGTNYLWNFGPGSFPQTLNGPAFQTAPSAFLTPGSHTVTVAVTTGGGVVNDSLTFTVQASGNTISLTANTNQICPQVTVIYSATPATYLMYAFFIDDTLRQFTTSSTDTVQLLGGDSIQVFGFNGTCFSAGSAFLHVNFTPPPATISSSILNDTICSGDLVVFTATPAVDSSYLFYDGGSLQQNTASNTWSTTQLGQGNDVFVLVEKNGCISGYSNIIRTIVKARPFVTDSASETGICTGDTITITAFPSGLTNYNFWVDSSSVQNGPGNTYTASNFTNNDTIRVNGTLNGCTSVFSSPIVIKEGAASLSLDSFGHVVCYGANNDTVTVNTGGNPAYHYLWSTGATTSSIVLGSGPFSVTVTNNTNSNCSAVLTDTITQDAQIHNTNILTLHLCVNPAHGDLTLDGQGGTGTLTYTVTGIGSDTSGLFPGLSPGGYSFIITDGIGCTQSGTVSIPQSIAGDSFQVVVDSPTCYGFNNGQIIIIPKNPGDGPFVYQLDGGSFLFTDTFTGVPSGPHSIVVKNFAFGCLYDLSASVGQPAQNFVSITPDTVMTHPGGLDTVTVTTTFPNPAFSWTPSTGLSCNNCAMPTVTADSTDTTYVVKVYTSPDSSCYVLDSVVVIVMPPVLPDSLIMPSGFAPNAQSPVANQTFGPVKAANFTNPIIKTFRIYNRWGQLIHNTIDYWDGKFDGHDQPVGTYIYYIEVQYPNPSEPSATLTYKKQGSVTLLR